MRRDNQKCVWSITWVCLTAGLIWAWLEADICTLPADPNKETVWFYHGRCNLQVTAWSCKPNTPFLHTCTCAILLHVRANANHTIIIKQPPATMEDMCSVHKQLNSHCEHVQFILLNITNIPDTSKSVATPDIHSTRPTNTYVQINRFTITTQTEFGKDLCKCTCTYTYM